MSKIGANHEATPAQVALNWLINFHGETVVAIPGASKVEHAEKSSGAMQFTLTPEELQKLDIASQKLQ